MFNRSDMEFSKTMKEDKGFGKSLWGGQVDSMMGSKVPIHLLAKMEIGESEEEYKSIMQPRACYNEYPKKAAFTGSTVHGDE